MQIGSHVEVIQTPEQMWLYCRFLSVQRSNMFLDEDSCGEDLQQLCSLIAVIWKDVTITIYHKKESAGLEPKPFPGTFLMIVNKDKT